MRQISLTDYFCKGLYLYNSQGASTRFDKYFNTIDNRADFFAASNLYEQNLGSKARWFGGADFVSRAAITGLYGSHLYGCLNALPSWHRLFAWKLHHRAK